MIPSVLTRQLHQGIRDFISATFPMASPYFQTVVDQFLDKPGNVFKGPFYQVGLPFLPAPEPGVPFSSLSLPGFHPYAHQVQAWNLLAGDDPASVLVATGTGSGKTECFLYPILDYCSRHRQPGIKAILLYPMNALADDQARRLAELISRQPGLSGLRAGVYTGAASESPQKLMTDQGLITDRNVLRDHPPDILLTNYKMLDFLLLRAEDRSLWRHCDLKFLVVDELHSFDGAQGTDLACLIRRLRERTNKTDRRSLACVGTSATLGGDEAVPSLLQFAKEVFCADFNRDNLVEERRLTEAQFLGDAFVTRMELPGFDSGEEPDYLQRQFALWFPAEGDFKDEDGRVRLGELLKSHGVFQNLLRFLTGRPRSQEELLHHFRKTYVQARLWPDTHLIQIVDSLFALISQARTLGPGGRLQPFLTVRTQFWLRELRRLVCEVNAQGPEEKPAPQLLLSDEIPAERTKTRFPLVHCRECHTAGWLTRDPPGMAPLIQDLKPIYNGYFQQSKDTLVLYPWESGDDSFHRSTLWNLCRDCGFLNHEKETACTHCHGTSLLAVSRQPLLDERGNFSQACPRCGSAGDLTVVGAKAAGLLAALVGQTFSSPFNSDKKLLVFSDSVQDAAHRAGFLTARSWTFSLRTALMQVVQRETDPLNLKVLPEKFLSCWKDRIGDASDFVGLFLPPDLEWTEDYASLQKMGELPEGSHLPAWVEKRLGWELISEFTYRSRIGRTLERTATALATVSLEALTQAARLLEAELRERQERFRQFGPESSLWLWFLWGIVHRLKNLGAVAEPTISLLFRSANTFTFHRSHPYMPSFARRSPRIVTHVPAKGAREPLLGGGGRRSWFQTWWHHCLSDQLSHLSLDDGAEDHEVLGLALNALMRAGLVCELSGDQDHSGWLLNPEALEVSCQVASIKCSQCGYALQVTRAEQGALSGLSCLRSSCRGHFQASEHSLGNYYRQFYTQGEVHRINGREHTGLLSGEDRKTLEESFIQGKHPWDPNLLSATPTLEMGINIGDLSTVFLCNVPPGVANFLQRIGRAGRKNGNAAVLTMAGAQPHDQYFFQAPQEMIQGLVESPAIYLEAAAVLERHLTAFLLGKWMQTLGANTRPIPRTLGDLLASFRNRRTETFPVGFALSLEKHFEPWLADFLQIFPQAEASLSQLTAPSVMESLEARFKLVQQDLDRMTDRRKTLKAKADQLRALSARTQEQNEELDALDREASGLASAVFQTRNKDTWQFLCDEGILPNYAFPEAGVKLKAIFWRKRQQPAKNGDRYSYHHVELVRSASSALRELAPENEFYGYGHRMKIERVDVRTAAPETWRFCPACTHAENETDEGYHQENCPRCRHPHWSDNGQVRQLIRFRTVFSNSSVQESQISDSQEDREPINYLTKLLVDFQVGDPDNRYFSAQNAQGSFSLDFLRRTTFREMNFGPLTLGAQGFSVAGDTQPKPGFFLCTHCGALSDDKHSPDCPGLNTQATVHLYHEFTSEAIRMLIPPLASGPESEIDLRSLMAAVYVGLREQFGGKVDHLKITDEQVSIGTGNCLNYLVIYDTIPGGSGYLKHFFEDAEAERTDRFFSLLQRAKDRLEGCGCRLDPEKDGCYRCLLSHRVSHHLREVSRTRALELIDRILDFQGDMTKVDFPALVQTDPLSDSKLEHMFLNALRTPQVWDVAVTATPEIFHGKTGTLLRVGPREYHLEQQVRFALHSARAKTVTADFVFWPLAQDERPVIVFTDGWTYHKDQIALDVSLRQALLKEGHGWVFSFSWDDILAAVENRPSAIDAKGHPWLGPAPSARLNAEFQRLGLAWQTWPGVSLPMGPRVLISMLSLEEAVRRPLWLKNAEYRLTGLLLSDRAGLKKVEAISDLLGDLRTGPALRHQTLLMVPGQSHHLDMALTLEQREHRGRIIGLLKYDAQTLDQDNWNGLLDFLNFCQILPDLYVSTPEQAALEVEALQRFEKTVNPEASADPWRPLAELIRKDWISLLEYLRESSFPLPEVGYEFMDDQQGVLACAEVAWPEFNVALLERDWEHKVRLLSPDWQILLWSPGEAFPELKGRIPR